MKSFLPEAQEDAKEEVKLDALGMDSSLKSDVAFEATLGSSTNAHSKLTSSNVAGERAVTKA